jgi:8-amino-7-oxononanoate synthase
LGLGAHARTRRAAADAAAGAYGCGPRGSALVCGYTDAHRALERALATMCETEACVLFPSGYAANATTLPAACGAEDCCIFSDALNHASIVDGCRLARQAGATVRTFAHGDYDALERALKTCGAKRAAVVSDSLFSMDGDYADVERLASLKRKYGFLLILDEAHATLVCGARGGGVAQARGRCADVDVHVGTLSKAVGAHGGFVACSREMKRFLVSRARGHMFSTALPAPVIAAALESLRVFADEPAIRAKLWRNVDRLNDALARSPTLATMARPLVSPIGSIVIGAPEAALAASAELFTSRIPRPAIRPPTVPAGTCRLRVALSASHRDQDIDDLARALEGAVATARAPRSRL